MKFFFRADNWGPNPKAIEHCIAEEGPNAGCGDVGTSAYEWVSYDPSDPTTLGWFSKRTRFLIVFFARELRFENRHKFSSLTREWDMDFQLLI